MEDSDYLMIGSMPIKSTLQNFPFQHQSTSSPILTTTQQYQSQESYVDYFDSRFPRFLSVILLVMGFFGNILCFYIFSQINMRKNATFIYLALLSVVDFFVIVLGLGDIIVISYFKFVLRDSSIYVCRVHTFLTYLFTHLSSFILAAVSIDRAIATNLIQFAKIYSKPKTAYKIIIIMTLMAIVINMHSLLFLGYYKPVNTNTIQLSNNLNLTNGNATTSYITDFQTNAFHCASDSGTLYDKFLDPYFKWIDLFSYAIIPFFTMAICTYLIVRVLIKSNQRLNKKNPTEKGYGKIFKNKMNNRQEEVKTEEIALIDTNKNLENIKNNVTDLSKNKQQQLSTVTLVTPLSGSSLSSKVTTGHKPMLKKTNARANKAKHLTYTLVTINCLFFCMVSPLVIILIFFENVENKFLINIVYLLAYSNHSFNFILYGISSPPYRESLFKIFRIVKIIKK